MLSTQVNEQDVQGATHTRVVNIIKFGGDTVVLKVFSVSPEEAGRLKRIEEVLLEDKRRSMRVRLAPTCLYFNSHSCSYLKGG